MSRKVADREIEQLLATLEDGNISEDGLEDESEDEETFFANAREMIRELEDEDAEHHEDPTYCDPPLVQDLPGPSSQIISSLPMQEASAEKGLRKAIEAATMEEATKKNYILGDSSHPPHISWAEHSKKSHGSHHDSRIRGRPKYLPKSYWGQWMSATISYLLRDRRDLQTQLHTSGIHADAELVYQSVI
ncbi:unnamed protein product, partial [Iphiclides podalirius]